MSRESPYAMVAIDDAQRLIRERVVVLGHELGHLMFVGVGGELQLGCFDLGADELRRALDERECCLG